MDRGSYCFLFFLWLCLSIGTILFIRSAEKAGQQHQKNAPFFIKEYLAGKKSSQLKDLDFHIPSPQAYDLLFQVMERPSVVPVELRENLEYYRRIIKYMPDMAEAYSLLAFCDYYQGDIKGSINNYLKAIKLRPENFWNYYDLAVIFWKNGARDAARQIMARALRTDAKTTLMNIYSSKIYRDILWMSAHKDYDPLKELQNAYHIAASFVQSPTGAKETVLDPQAKVRIF